jgi:nicotinamidase-related amidase
MLDLAEAVPPAKTALIVVDVQNAFGPRHSTIGRRGNDLSGYRQMVAERLLPLVAAARRAGVASVLPRTDSDVWTTNPAARDPAGYATLPYGDEDRPPR